MSSKFFAKMGAKTTLSRTTCLRFFVGLKPLGIVHGSNLQPGSSRYRAFDIHGMNGAAILQPIEPPVLTVELERAAGPYIKGVQKVRMPTYNCYVAESTELAATGARRNQT